MKTIRKPGEYAPYILIRLAADCFKRTIFFYRDKFTWDISKEIFLPFNQKEISLRDSIKLLFQGRTEAGHYDLIVDNTDLQIHPVSESNSEI